MTIETAAPTLPQELEGLLRRLRLPHLRRLAPEVLATARAQRWEPAEVLKVLLHEELEGRERSSTATRREAAGFPTRKTFAGWEPHLWSVPLPTQEALRTLEWVSRLDNLLELGMTRADLHPLVDKLLEAPLEPAPAMLERAKDPIIAALQVVPWDNGLTPRRSARRPSGAHGHLPRRGDSLGASQSRARRLQLKRRRGTLH